jgi:hypothetical protein
MSQKEEPIDFLSKAWNLFAFLIKISQTSKHDLYFAIFFSLLPLPWRQATRIGFGLDCCKFKFTSAPSRQRSLNRTWVFDA